MTETRSGEPWDRAATSPCPECPWRVSNKGRPVPEKYAGTYDRKQRTVIWAELRSGVPQGCHLSTGDREKFPHGGDPEWIDAGYAAVPEIARPRECAGAVAAALREMRLLLEAGGWQEYHRRRPQGLTREVATRWAARLSGVSPPGVPALRAVQVDAAEVIDVPGEDDLTAVDLIPPRRLAEMAAVAENVMAGLRAKGLAK